MFTSQALKIRFDNMIKEMITTLTDSESGGLGLFEAVSPLFCPFYPFLQTPVISGTGYISPSEMGALWFDQALSTFVS